MKLNKDLAHTGGCKDPRDTGTGAPKALRDLSDKIRKPDCSGGG